MRKMWDCIWSDTTCKTCSYYRNPVESDTKPECPKGYITCWRSWEVPSDEPIQRRFKFDYLMVVCPVCDSSFFYRLIDSKTGDWNCSNPECEFTLRMPENETFKEAVRKKYGKPIDFSGIAVKHYCPKCGDEMRSNEGNTGGVDAMLFCINKKCRFTENIADHAETGRE